MASNRQKGPGIVRMGTSLVRAPFYELYAREEAARSAISAMEQVTRIAQRPEVNRDGLRIAKQERRTQEKQHRREQNRPDRVDVL